MPALVLDELPGHGTWEHAGVDATVGPDIDATVARIDSRVGADIGWRIVVTAGTEEEAQHDEVTHSDRLPRQAIGRDPF